jgi:hypothetical protein
VHNQLLLWCEFLPGHPGGKDKQPEGGKILTLPACWAFIRTGDLGGDPVWIMAFDLSKVIIDWNVVRVKERNVVGVQISCGRLRLIPLVAFSLYHTATSLSI